ncbi:hypothetical protein FOZ62_005642 [Perkinsus olseni]|uniref:Uncharacterized protein n=1 Tax=Perkinsus olseni TaxID=32597 RepID=A0A7J6PV35_PEROL|nr:hypothetical protein FOZ62_005642 [Perkinsus olseni]
MVKVMNSTHRSDRNTISVVISKSRQHRLTITCYDYLETNPRQERGETPKVSPKRVWTTIDLLKDEFNATTPTTQGVESCDFEKTDDTEITDSSRMSSRECCLPHIRRGDYKA